MMRSIRRVFLFLLGLSLMSTAHAASCVVLVHGLLGQPWNWFALAPQLEQRGYQVEWVKYPSRKLTIAEAGEWLAPAIAACGDAPIDLVGHSLGGLLIQSYISKHPQLNVRRVVLLGTPNLGTELAETRHQHWWYERQIARWLGPVLPQLQPAARTQTQWPAAVQIGVIAGSYTPSPWLNKRFASPNDGLVPIWRTQVSSQTDFTIVPATHVGLLTDPDAIRQLMWFLQTGHFFHLKHAPSDIYPSRDVNRP